MTRYRWDGDRFVDRDGQPMPVPQRDYVPSPYMMSDVNYECVVTNRPITSRSERREVMKRHNLREVDPSEGPPAGRWQSKKWAERMRGDWEPRKDGGKFESAEGVEYKRLSKDELPKRLRK